MIGFRGRRRKSLLQRYRDREPRPYVVTGLGPFPLPGELRRWRRAEENALRIMDEFNERDKNE